MTERTQKLIRMASEDPNASSGQQQLAKIINALRSLDRKDIRCRFEADEIGDIVEYVLFEEVIDD
jgi:hypothetical protein